MGGTIVLQGARIGESPDDLSEKADIFPLRPGVKKSQGEMAEYWQKVQANKAAGRLRGFSPVILKMKNATLYCLKAVDVLVCDSADVPWHMGFVSHDRTGKEVKEVEAMLASME
jgi:hypothetical protein